VLKVALVFSPKEWAFVNGLDVAKRRELLSDGVVSAYKLSGMCTLFAAYNITSCLDPQYRVEFENGFREAKRKVEELHKPHEEALNKAKEDAKRNFGGRRRRPPTLLRKPMGRERKLNNRFPP